MIGFLLLVWAESRKVFSRGSGLGALIIGFLVGLVAVGGLFEVQHMQGGASVNGQSVSSMVDFTATSAAGFALQMRNFFVLPTLLLLATASAMAGEYADRTLRELVVRPVHRWTILAAKLVALSLLALATLVLTFLPSFGVGLALWGAPTEGVGNLVLGYSASFLSDLGLLLIGMLASLFVPSVGGVVVTVVLVLMADRALWGGLKILSMFQVAQADTMQQFTLVNALGCWEGWKDGWVWERFAALGVVVFATAVLSVARFTRMDVP